MTPTPTAEPTEVPELPDAPPGSPPLPPALDHIELQASPTVSPGNPVTLSWGCDFSSWNYKNVPVNIFLAVVKNPLVADGPSRVKDARAGDRIYFFKPGMKPSASLDGPTFRKVRFPPAPTSGSLSLKVPLNPQFTGDWKFAIYLVYAEKGTPVRDDGLPVRNSNVFKVE
jgi:hypothetical protein